MFRHVEIDEEALVPVRPAAESDIEPKVQNIKVGAVPWGDRRAANFKVRSRSTHPLNQIVANKRAGAPEALALSRIDPKDIVARTRKIPVQYRFNRREKLNHPTRNEP